MQVKDRMTTSLVWIRGTASLRDAIELMAERKVRHLLVRGSSGSLEGIVSDRDLRLIQPSRAWQERADVETGLWSLTVGQAMTRDVVTVSPQASLADAAGLMLDGHVGALPVLAQEAVVGIISERDLLDVVAQRAPQPAIFRVPAGADSLAATRTALRQCRSVAVIGLGPDTESLPDLETSKLLAFDINVYPIHETEHAILGLRCYPSLGALPERVDVVQVFPGSSQDLRHIVNETIRTRAKVFWYEGPELPNDVLELLRIEHIGVVVGHSLQAELFNVRL